MARGTGEPSTKRAKVDEAGKEEEEDPLVRRREELVRLLGRARKGKEVNKRAKEELVTLCARLEAKNEKLLGRLLPELWQKIVDENLHPNDLLALAMTCRFFREKQKDLGTKVVTNLYIYRLLGLQERGKIPSHTLGWFQWVCDTFEILPGYELVFGEGCKRPDERAKDTVYDGDLVNYAAFQGSVEILKWLMEKEGYELNWYTGDWAAMGGSIETLEYLRERGYKFDRPSTCREAASGNGHEHVIEWIDQQEKEEEDALVRRREELALSFANTWAKGKELGARLVREAEEERYSKAEGERLVREAKERAILESDRTLREARLSFGQELRSVCAKLEAKNEKLLGRLPPEIWQKILDDYLHQNDMLAFAMACRFFRDTTKDHGKKLETNLNYGSLFDLRKSGKVASHSLGWFQWVCDTFEFLPGFKWPGYKVKGAVYEGFLLNYAVFQGSVEILRWLMEEKGYEFNRATCEGAAFGGHLDVLKFLRAQDPPCPWDLWTCSLAAEGGQLEVLKWLRSEDPPCTWRRSDCREIASHNDHQHIVDWIDRQEDESDVE